MAKDISAFIQIQSFALHVLQRWHQGEQKPSANDCQHRHHWMHEVGPIDVHLQGIFWLWDSGYEKEVHKPLGWGKSDCGLHSD